MSQVIVHAHPDMFMSPPLVEIGGGWLGVAEKVIQDLKSLHPGLRVGAMFKDSQGMLQVDVAFEAGDYDSDILDRVLEITSQARLYSAWACHVDGKPGWLVDAPDGRRPLCPACQRRRGLKGMRHAA
ncbi:hypothetical protein J2Y63_004197 [Shinella sp. BE166]|uniref:hypothetical protein n=1 Tax=Shinella sp. BE166 TaxID=3373918 RepID=UPI003EBEDE9B